MLVSNQRAGKHNCTRPSDMYVTAAPDQKPCLYNLLTINYAMLHVCYSFILSAIHVYYICTRPSAMSVTIASGHLPGLSLLRLTSSHVCKNLHLQACMSDTLALDQHSYLI